MSILWNVLKLKECHIKVSFTILSVLDSGSSIMSADLSVRMFLITTRQNRGSSHCTMKWLSAVRLQSLSEFVYNQLTDGVLSFMLNICFLGFNSAQDTEFHETFHFIHWKFYSPYTKQNAVVGILYLRANNKVLLLIILMQRLGSQERENSAKRMSCLPQINYTREESQMQLSKPSGNYMRKWSVPENKCKS